MNNERDAVLVWFRFLSLRIWFSRLCIYFRRTFNVLFLSHFSFVCWVVQIPCCVKFDFHIVHGHSKLNRKTLIEIRKSDWEIDSKWRQWNQYAECKYKLSSWNTLLIISHWCNRNRGIPNAPVWYEIRHYHHNGELSTKWVCCFSMQPQMSLSSKLDVQVFVENCYHLYPTSKQFHPEVICM